MNELFEKIYIKSGADLPKEKGFYITGIGQTTAFNPEEKLIKPFQSDSVEFWMKCVDYYLRPVEQKPDCYDKEFVLWLCFGSHPFVRWFDENGDYFTDELSDKRWSIDELHSYWLTHQK